eukprot:m.282488 g.282488  ORF g.282488 m.282488 type:complete len:89 (+) comp11111_c0_seq19:3218-3484(+)
MSYHEAFAAHHGHDLAGQAGGMATWHPSMEGGSFLGRALRYNKRVSAEHRAAAAAAAAQSGSGAAMTHEENIQKRRERALARIAAMKG